MNERERQEQLRRERERGPNDEERDRKPAQDKPAQEEWDRKAMRDEVQARDVPPTADEAHRAPEALLGGETAVFRQEWESIQASFVDEPRQAVERADKLVAGAAQRITEEFARERQRLAEQWGHGGDVSTEDLRMALRRYRAFFERLLSI